MRLLQVEKLSCQRGECQLFSNLSFTLEASEILHIGGANGSGKTTLLRMLAGLISYTKGKIRHHAKHYAYLGHRLGLNRHLSVYENLRFSQTLFISKLTIEEVLTQVKLVNEQHKLVAELSAGQQRRAAIAQLLLQKADLWLLDEPLTALDKASIEIMQRLILQQASVDGSVILASHQALQLHGVKEINLDRV